MDIFKEITEQEECTTGWDTSKSVGFPTPVPGEFFHDENGIPQQVWEYSGNFEHKIEYTRDPDDETMAMASVISLLKLYPKSLISLSGYLERECWSSGKTVRSSLDERDIKLYDFDDPANAKITFNPLFPGSASEALELGSEDVKIAYSIRFVRDQEAYVAAVMAYQDALKSTPIESIIIPYEELEQYGIDTSEINEETYGVENAIKCNMSFHATGVQYETETGMKIWCPEPEYYKGAHRAGCVALINNDFGDVVEGAEFMTSGTFDIQPRAGVENGATITIENNIITKFITPQE